MPRQCRPKLKTLMDEIVLFCKAANITGSTLYNETGYKNANKLLHGELCTMSYDSEELLRLWLQEKRAQLSGAAKEKPQLGLPLEPVLDPTPVEPRDRELALMQSLANIVDNFRGEVSPDALLRATTWLRERG